MKKLKIKLGLLSLLAVLAVSVFLTSCEQETIPSIPEETVTDNLLGEGQDTNHEIHEDYLVTSNEYYLPLSVDRGTEAEIKEYLKNITPELQAQLVEHTRVIDYLDSVNKLDEVIPNISPSDLLLTSNVATYLTDEEVQQLSHYDSSSNIESRECSAWRSNGCSHALQGDFFPLCYVKWVCQDKRDCEWHDFFSARYRTTYSGPTHKCH